MSSALVEIEERIDGIECELAFLAPLVHERARLLRARAALLGEREPEVRHGPGGPRVTHGDVFEYLVRHPGSGAGEIAVGLGIVRPAVSAHLYRGRDRIFATQDGRWYPIPAADPRAAGAPAM